MKTLYFDCFAGASGDMILGALLDLGVPQEYLRGELAKLPVQGWSLECVQVERAHLSAWHVRVVTRREHQHRGLQDILGIIEGAGLSAAIKERAGAIFRRLAEAEAKVHNIPLEQVHFHEVGALDAIIDVLGACIGFAYLGIEHFVASPLHVGSGLVKMAHGVFPVPPPAVAELVRGLPVYSDGRPGELLTPTGAAIISTVCKTYGPLPQMRWESIGYGAGTRTYKDFPNVLRLCQGVLEKAATEENDNPETETLCLLETNLDDATPELCGYVLERALAAGALDGYLIPVQMKKNRPGVLLTLLCRTGTQEILCDLLFRETTTIGVRRQSVERTALARKTVTVNTAWGAVDVKVASWRGQITSAKPEYEQCRAYARQFQVPLKEVIAAAQAAWHAQVTFDL